MDGRVGPELHAPGAVEEQVHAPGSQERAARRGDVAGLGLAHLETGSFAQLVG